MRLITNILIILLVCQSVCSQTTNGYNDKIANGKLNYGECEVLIKSGNAELALPSLKNLLDIYEKDSANIEDYLKIVISLVNYYNTVGDLISSHELLEKSQELMHLLKYYNNTPITRAFNYAQGREQTLLRSYVDALHYYFLALMKCNQANDKSDFYIDLLCDISLGYQNLDDLLMSSLYIDEAKELYEEKYGGLFEDKGNIDELQFNILNTYGKLYYMMNKWDEAEKTYTFIIKTHQDYEIEDTELLSIAFNNLSQIMIAQHRYKECLYYLSLINCNNNKELEYLVSQNMSVIHLLLGNKREAVSYLKAFNSVAKQNVVSVFSNYSGMDRESYWDKYAKDMISLNDLVAYKTQDSDAIEQAYNNMLFCNTLLIESERTIRKYVSESTELLTKKFFDEYLVLRDSLSNNGATKERTAYMLAKKEEALLRSIDDFEKLIQNASGTWKDVAKTLEDNEVAIEFCYVDSINSIADLNGFYGAFVLRKNSITPKLVLLDEISEIDSIIHKNDEDIFNINSFYGSNSPSFYKLVWERLEPYLNDCSVVYYSTTGQLSNINFDIIADLNGTYLNEKYKLIRVSSTNRIANVKLTNMPNFANSVLYGDIKYNESLAEMTKESERYTNDTNSPLVEGLTLRAMSSRGNWNHLSATKFEVSTIKDILIKNHIFTQTVTGTTANEESFKALSGNSPDIIHLATHGYYISSSEKAEDNTFINQLTPYSEKEKYLQWSGLLMAGANNVWNGGFNLKNVEDGILTADEISRLDLSKTKMVILSACETARGHIDPVDGVFGLQQAFKKAGVGTIVMSLWKVPDEATSLLMEHFYKELMGGNEKHDSLKIAMKYVRQKYNDPYYWAGFIMLD